MAGMTFRNTGYIRLHTTVPSETRTYLKFLSGYPGLMPPENAGVDQLFSIGVCAFLAQRPYLEDKWEWHRPSGPNTNPDWVVIHPSLVDVPVEGELVESKMLNEQIAALGNLVPKIRANDSGRSQVIYSIIHWMTNKLFKKNRSGIPTFKLPVLTKADIKLIKKPV